MSVTLIIGIGWGIGMLLLAFAIGYQSGREQNPIDELERMYYR